MTRSRRLPAEGRRRAIIERVEPEVDGGRFAAKRVRGDDVVVRADAFCDGHDELSCALRYRHEEEKEWREVEMEPLGNDRWEAAFEVAELGRYLYRPIAWVDRFKTWRHDLEKRLAAGQDVTQDLLVGAALVEEAAARARGEDRKRLERWAGTLREDAGEPVAQTAKRARAGAGRARAKKAAAGAAAQPPGAGAGAPRDHRALSRELEALMERHPDRREATEYHAELAVLVDRKRAGFSAWYELFPRSAADEPGRHGTFEDVEKLLPYIRDMGFDVLYLPPIHPIGRTKRKGPNNTPSADPDDPGSPWAIGSEEGGHTAIHPRLGTPEDFRRLVRRAEEEGLEIALDIALQCSPDHPWVGEHPEWFRARPDGSIQYAENPPKKYEDIYPFDFETDAWQDLWRALADIFFHWIEQGVRIFRVDNPHTKPFAFWEWVIAEVKERYPEVIFLSEAFTRPKVMNRLAKLGFTQSYTYFTWRNGSWELRTYLEDLTTSPVSDFFRPSFWPNTPDILSEYLQTGGRGAFMARLVLAATLSSCYGIYGPAFELRESEPRGPGSEEYLGSEKYEIRHWDLDREDSLRGFIRRINRIRQENPALHATRNLRFHGTDNEQLIAFSKVSADGSNILLVVVNLDPHHVQSGWVDLAPGQLGLEEEDEFRIHDQLADQHFVWHGGWNYVELDPAVVPAHVFRVAPRVRSETDFEYYM